MELFIPRHKSMTLWHNAHFESYEKLEDFAGACQLEFETEEAEQRAIETNECWGMQWYPDNPVGFYAVCAPTLAELFDYVRRLDEQIASETPSTAKE